MSLPHVLPACAATDPPWRQSIALAASLWEIACQHGLGQSTRSEYRGQLAEVLARYPAFAARPAAVPAGALAPAANLTARGAAAGAGAPGAVGASAASSAPIAPAGRRQRGAPR